MTRASESGRASILAALVFAAGCSDRAAPAPVVSKPAPKRPDIVLISIASLRADHLGCYGYARKTSPVIDRIAEAGVRCTTALSTTSWTLPAHAALFTGLFDSTHGVVDNALALSDRLVTLPVALHERGYHCAGFFGGPYLHPLYGFARGFDSYTNCMSPVAAAEVLSGGSKGESSSSHAGITGPRTAAAVEQWIGSIDERPFFLFVHLWDVHYDYQPTPYVDEFDPGFDGTLDFTHVATNPAINDHMAPRDLEHLVALYDGQIRSSDDVLGRIFDALSARGRLDEALIVISADHGEEFFEHGGKGHQHTLFEEVVRVPLIVRWKNHLPAKSVVRDMVRLVDVMPTLLSAAGAGLTPKMQGRDLAPLFEGRVLAPEPALLELLVDHNDVRALRLDEMKIIDWRSASKTTLGFHLIRDAREGHPFPDTEEWVQKGRAKLDVLLEQGRTLRAELKAAPLAIAPGPELDRRLRALGYTGVGTAEPK